MGEDRSGDFERATGTGADGCIGTGDARKEPVIASTILVFGIQFPLLLLLMLYPESFEYKFSHFRIRLLTAFMSTNILNVQKDSCRP